MSGEASKPEPLLARFFSRLARGKRPAGAGILETCFGPLENRVLDALWTRRGAASVGQLQDTFPEIAYTTLMTTLDRLFKKGLLERGRNGRAYTYRPRLDRAGLEALLLSGLVDAIGADDALLLDELERIVREKRRTKRRGDAR